MRAMRLAVLAGRLERHNRVEICYLKHKVSPDLACVSRYWLIRL